MSNPNPENQFKPGQSGNPGGRPKNEWTWSSLVREAMDEEGDNGQAIKKNVSRALVTKALTGDVQALREIGNRLDGMPKQNLGIDATGTFTVIIDNVLNKQ